MLADLAVLLADGGDTLAHLATVRDHQKAFGPVASDPTAWRCLERVDEEHLAFAGRPCCGAGSGLGCWCRSGAG